MKDGTRTTEETKTKNKNPALSQLEGDERHPAADVIPGTEVFTVPRTSGLNERLM